VRSDALNPASPLIFFEQTMKKVIALSLVAIVLAGCNTISGIGRDVSKVGQVVTGAGGK